MKKFTIDQIIKILAEADTPGNSVAATARKYGLSEQTIYRWRKKYRGFSASEAKRASVVSKLFELYWEDGKIFEFRWDLYDGHHVVFKPERVSVGKLQEWAYELHHRFYSLREAVRFLLMRRPLRRLSVLHRPAFCKEMVARKP